MLLNDFFTYEVLEQSDGKMIATIRFNKKHDIYKGHFPEIPITPGVCQVQMVQEVLRECLNSNFFLKSARDIKFLNLINPMKIDSLQLELNWSVKDDESLAVRSLLYKDDVNYLKMNSIFVRR